MWPPVWGALTLHFSPGEVRSERSKSDSCMHFGPENALKALALLGGGPFLPIRWGALNLAMHAWDQPAEFLLESAPKLNAQLLMPRLREPIEPAPDGRIDPWWRSVDIITQERAASAPREVSLPKSLLADRLAVACAAYSIDIPISFFGE